jgi:hypothetical protein
MWTICFALHVCVCARRVDSTQRSLGCECALTLLHAPESQHEVLEPVVYQVHGQGGHLRVVDGGGF